MADFSTNCTSEEQLALGLLVERVVVEEVLELVEGQEAAESTCRTDSARYPFVIFGDVKSNLVQN